MRIVAAAEQPRQHTLTVRFENRQALVERLRQHGVAGVLAEAGQTANEDRIGRKLAVVFGGKDARAAMQIAGTAIVAESRPEMQHLLFGRGGERGDARELEKRSK